MTKKVFISLAIILLPFLSSMGQNSLNNAADNIVGIYSGNQKGDKFKAKIVKLSDGTYRGQVIWMEHDKDANGKKLNQQTIVVR